MIQKAIHTFLLRRHFWRHADFDELSELYISMMFRSLANSLIGIFVPVYLLKLGYGFPAVMLFYAYFFGTRIFMDIIGGYVVARIGPKHTMLLSYVVQIVSSIAFMTLPEYNWPLPAVASMWAASQSLFFIAYHVDFSKIKHSEHGGKEISHVHIMEKFGVLISPIVGGAVATVFGAQYTFMISVLLLASGTIPLFATGEAVRTHQFLTFHKFPFRQLRRDFLSYAFSRIEFVLCINLWPVFLTLFVLGHNAYAELGILASLSVLASIVSVRAIGRLIDSNKGRTLMRVSAAANAIAYGFRPFVSTAPMALGVNVVNEVLTSGYNIPYTKGLYDRADSLPGYRIAYIVAMESIGECAKTAAWLVLYVISLGYSERSTLNAGFAIASISSLLIMTESFAALQNPSPLTRLQQFGQTMLYRAVRPLRFSLWLAAVFALSGTIVAALIWS